MRQGKWTAILAGTYQQYLSWCRENGKSPYGDRVFYITDTYSLRGHHNFDVVKYGTWYERKDLADIQDEISIFKETEKVKESK